MNTYAKAGLILLAVLILCGLEITRSPCEEVDGSIKPQCEVTP